MIPVFQAFALRIIVAPVVSRPGNNRSKLPAIVARPPDEAGKPACMATNLTPDDEACHSGLDPESSGLIPDTGLRRYDAGCVSR
jgi:hypothetical protein